MHLINVQAILNIEERKAPWNKVLKHFYGMEIDGIEYAILSYCWCASEEQELRFSEIRNLSIDAAHSLEQHGGYQKVVRCCKKARDDRIEWLWTAPCCVSWQNSTEMSKAVNSMYRWYANSKRCYAYLQDVNKHTPSTEDTFTRSKWFECSWTLQELLAPRDIEFFDCHWTRIGDKASLVPTLTDITGIPQDILMHGLPPSHHPYRPSVAQIMSWASRRQTNRTEDQAYSLIGLFGVHLAVQYGEKEYAFQRLQEAIIKEYNDHTIFAWFTNSRRGSVLADNPSCFRDSSDIIGLDPYIAFSKCPQAIAELKSHGGFHITKIGIELWLPLCTVGSEPGNHVQATLACCRSGNPKPIILDLSLAFTEYDDVFLREVTSIDSLSNGPVFQSLYFVHRQHLPPKVHAPHAPPDLAFIVQQLDPYLVNASDVVPFLLDEMSHWTTNLDDWAEIEDNIMKLAIDIARSLETSRRVYVQAEISLKLVTDIAHLLRASKYAPLKIRAGIEPERPSLANDIAHSLRTSPHAKNLDYSDPELISVIDRSLREHLDGLVDIQAESPLKLANPEMLRGFLPSAGALVALKIPRVTSSAWKKEDMEVTSDFLIIFYLHHTNDHLASNA